ncbi:MAG: hypothetical protein V4653_15010 [Pseudomonadota bacterium]
MRIDREGRPVGLLIRLLLGASGIVAGMIVARDAPNFGIVQAMLGLWIVVIMLGAAAWITRR